MRIKLSQYELALIIAALAWDRKTHGIILNCDSSSIWHVIKWKICGWLWKLNKDFVQHLDMFLLCHFSFLEFLILD